MSCPYKTSVLIDLSRYMTSPWCEVKSVLDEMAVVISVL